jgi:peptidoglycan/LPS O-acetylase OafA/YrhL
MSATGGSAHDERHRGAHDLPQLEDPGKEDRARAGLPVVPAFDGFRAYAILGIVVFHTFNASGITEASAPGWGGQLIWGTFGHLVDVLFILSGFVVFLPTVARGGDFGSVSNYAIRRAARLLPAYWLVLVLCILVMAIWPVLGAIPNASEIAVNVTGTHQVFALFSSGYLPGFGIDLPMWTLSIEIGFYVVLPFCAAAYFRHPLAGLATAALIAIAWRLFFDNFGSISDSLNLGLTPQEIIDAKFDSGAQVPSWAFSFGAGMTAAWLYVRLTTRHSAERLASAAVPAALAALAVLAILAYAAGRYAIDNPFPLPAVVARENILLAFGYTGALAALMLAISLCPRRVQLPFAHPVVRKLGDISYGIYLIHSVIIVIALVEFNPLRDASFEAFLLWTVIIVPVSIVWGYLSARFVEQPIRRWARQFGRRAEPSGPAAPSGAAAGGETR